VPSISTEAIVLRRVNYRDNDRMLTLFSPTLGRMDALARGCRKAAASLTGATELFCSGEYQFHQNRDRLILTGCAIRESFYPLREDYDRLVCGSYLLALCEAALQAGEGHPDVYALLLNALARLSYGRQPATALTAVFILQFAEMLGYRPRLDVCAQCGADVYDGAPVRFSAPAGGILCRSCGASAATVPPGTLRFLREAQGHGFDCAMDAPDEIHAEAMQRMRGYMESRAERAIKASKLLPQAPSR